VFSAIVIHKKGSKFRKDVIPAIGGKKSADLSPEGQAPLQKIKNSKRYEYE
jgi:hypothetical protein